MRPISIPTRFLLGLSGLIALTACGADNSSSQEAISPVPEKFYAVGSAHEEATNAGLQVLKNGGNAVDAAIAVQAVLGLVEPQSSGLGGGAFMMLYDPKTGEVRSFDGREVAPQSARPDMFLKDDGTPMDFYDGAVSGKSVGVPGAIAMLAEVHDEYGTKDWSELLSRARQMADEGFVINERLAMLTKKFARLKAVDPDTARYFYNENGEPKPAGTILKNPDYVKTLDAIAADPRHALLSGEIGQSIIDKVNSVTGEQTMTMADLTHYAPQERDVVCGPYRSYTICSMGPPSSGAVTLLQILGILENTEFDKAPPQSPLAWHYYLEAVRLAYADRGLYLADPDYMQLGNLGPDEIVKGMLDEDYLKTRAKLINPERANPTPMPGDFRAALDENSPRFAMNYSPDYISTSHFTIIDADGMVVSMTTTVEFIFGAHIMASGFILNNQLTDFSFVPERNGKAVANAVAPGKRPRSSMTPIIVFDENGDVVMAFGSPGGSRIITYVAKTLIGVIDWDMDLQAAIDMTNIGAPYGDAMIEVHKFPHETADLIGMMGHVVKPAEMTSGVYGFMRKDGQWQGGADKRKPGTAVIVPITATE